MSQARAQRVADQIQRDLAVLLQREVKDPRIGLATISGVEVSKDLQNAKVYVTFLDKDDLDEINEAVEVLRKASGFLRSQIAKAMRMRAVPALRFFYDKSIVEGQKMKSLIEQAMDSDKNIDDDSVA